MHNWSPQEWATLITAAISAFAAAVVSIINAVNGHKDRQQIKTRVAALTDRMDEHETNAVNRSASLRAELNRQGKIGP